jgi:hypothetical protein
VIKAGNPFLRLSMRDSLAAVLDGWVSGSAAWPEKSSDFVVQKVRLELKCLLSYFDTCGAGRPRNALSKVTTLCDGENAVGLSGISRAEFFSQPALPNAPPGAKSGGRISPGKHITATICNVQMTNMYVVRRHKSEARESFWRIP